MAPTPQTRTLRVMPMPRPTFSLWRLVPGEPGTEEPGAEGAVGVGAAAVFKLVDGERPARGVDWLGIEVGNV